MPEMTVTFHWDEELGPRWMNMANLKLLLYGQMYTKPELLGIDFISAFDDEGQEFTDVDA